MSEERKNYSRTLINICYPGVVNNEHKAIETLGGIKSISKVCASSNHRLELRFRPQDPFCKVACSSNHPTAGILLKIRVKKKKNGSANEAGTVIGTEILGVVRESYIFDSLVDFQYMPLAPKDEANPSAGLKPMLNDLVPQGLPDGSWLDEPAPYFFVPPIFSRMSVPQNYAYSAVPEKEKDSINKNIVQKFRKPRTNYAIYIGFNHTDPTPAEPNKNTLELVSFSAKYLEQIKELFNKRPIWSKAELGHISKIPLIHLKFLLPSCAYFYLNGPWRGFWVRFGYDPRKDPQSRIYQCMDYRVRGGLKIYKSKNISHSFLPKKEYKRVKAKNFLMAEPEDDKPRVPDEVSGESYIFKPDTFPLRKQNFYNYCNVQIPEVQEMLSKLGEVLPGSLCHERRGWLPSGFQDQCREIMNSYINRLIKMSSETTQSIAGSEISPEEEKDDMEETQNDEDENPNEEDAADGGLSEFEEDDLDDDDDDNVFQDETGIDLDLPIENRDEEVN